MTLPCLRAPPERASRPPPLLAGCTHAISRLQLLPSTAACPASYPYECLPRVVVGDGHLFAALWEGHGGAQAARHCVAHCYEVLMAALQQEADVRNPAVALQQAVEQLEASFFESNLPDLVSTQSITRSHY